MSETSKVLLKTMERALKNTKIAEKYDLSLKTFFKDKYRYWDDSYLIPYSEVKNFKKHIFEFIKSSCNNESVCSKLQSCNGHRFLNFIELILNFHRFVIIQKKIFYKYFLFTNFELTTNSNKITLKPTEIKSWRAIAVDKHELNHLTYSQRLSYLK